MAKYKRKKRLDLSTTNNTNTDNVFIKEYLGNGFNGTQAYLKAHPRASYDTANTEGCKYLVKPCIMDAIDKQIRERMQKMDVTNDSVVAQLRDSVFMDTRQFYNEDGSFKDIHDLNYSQQAVIESIETEELFDGKGEDRKCIGTLKKIKFRSRTKDREQLMKYFGMLHNVTDINLNGKIEVSTSVEELRKKGLSIRELENLRDLVGVKVN